uniref:Aminoglycoside phosphotransferase domain-containing protein n=1 Tax=Globodera rostochiensis TaxID=31243 RepID=A0A914I084_GLORO
MQQHSLSFRDVRTWRELLAHRLALCDREDKLLRHLHTFVGGQIAHPPMVPPLPDKAHLWDGIGTAVDENVAIFDDGRQFVDVTEEGLSSEQIEQAITALAQFHALSTESPQLCGADTLPTLSHPKPENELVIKEWLLDVLLTLPECDYFRKNEHPLRNFLQKIGFGFKDEQIVADSPHKEFPIVLCHGNFCVNNIVFCSPDTKCVGKSLSPIILSWELAHPGHGISDVVHLLLSSVNSSVRIQRQDQWIALYAHKFEQFIQLQRKQNRNGKSSMPQMLARNKKMENAVKKQKQKFRALLPGQLLRVLPKLAMDYRKLAETAQLNSEQIGQYNWKRCALLGRMIGGFEMVRKDFEKK